MYLNPNQRGYGWHVTVDKDKKGDSVDKSLYLDFSFKKGTEPSDDTLSQYGSYMADLYLIDRKGKRKVGDDLTKSLCLFQCLLQRRHNLRWRRRRRRSPRRGIETCYNGRSIGRG